LGEFGWPANVSEPIEIAKAGAKRDAKVRALGIPQRSSIDPEVIRNANCLIRDGIYRCIDLS